MKGHMSAIDASSSHKRSKSDFDEREVKEMLGSSLRPAQQPERDMGKFKDQIKLNKKTLPGRKIQSSLRQEILQLEKRLQEQLAVRGALGKALGHKPAVANLSNDCSMPKPTKELIREIAILELEVKNLEQYLLSLYRKAFEQQMPTLSPTSSDISKQPLSSRPGQLQETAKLDAASTREDLADQSNRPQIHKKRSDAATENSLAICPEKLVDPGVHRSHSALSYRAVCSARISPSEESMARAVCSARILPSEESLARALQSFHSQPLSFLEEDENATSGVISLADYLGTNIADCIPETPNRLSEEMVRCMTGIYCKLADPPLLQHGASSSPTSSFSSTSAFSPQHLGDAASPACKRESTLDARLINPFRVEGLKEFSGPYNTMVEVPLICRDRRRLRDAEALIRNYNSIIQQLETVDLRNMTNAEKIAFWVNIHNALVMNAYLEYGIPQNNAKKESLLAKAVCNIGGRSINAAMIQGLFLGCHTYCPGLWLRTLIHARKKKNKPANEWQAYSIEQPEPLLRFALCSGSHSDPAVRAYTPKRLFQQLESAKEEFIRATVGIWKEQKILLPKLVESYAKDVKLSSQGLFDTVQRYLPETLRMAMQRCRRGRSSKIVDWVPYNSGFRYLLSRDLAFPHLI